jgi:hypothetical protein
MPTPTLPTLPVAGTRTTLGFGLYDRINTPRNKVAFANGGGGTPAPTTGQIWPR